MNNIELEQKIKGIINKNNYFDMIIAAKEFEAEYKKSDFYKATKKPLNEVIKESKIYYFTNFNTMLEGLQKIINSVNTDNLSKVINEFSEMFATENAEVFQSIESMKSILNEIKN